MRRAFYDRKEYRALSLSGMTWEAVNDAQVLDRRSAAVMALGEVVLEIAKRAREIGGAKSFAEELARIIRDQGTGAISAAIAADAGAPVDID